jgi:competence protein ComEC
VNDWSIRDESTRHRFFFPNGFVLAGNGQVRVFSGCGDDDATSLYWCDGDPVWNNSGDTAFLVDQHGRFVDTLGYQG